jgi:hypothetical protein
LYVSQWKESCAARGLLPLIILKKTFLFRFQRSLNMVSLDTKKYKMTKSISVEKKIVFKLNSTARIIFSFEKPFVGHVVIRNQHPVMLRILFRCRWCWLNFHIFPRVVVWLSLYLADGLFHWNIFVSISKNIKNETEFIISHDPRLHRHKFHLHAQ